MTNAATSVRGLRTVIYHAPDLHKAKAWYAQVLDKQPYFDEAFYVGFEVGGFELGLVPDASSPGRGGVTAYWGVGDAKAATARLEELGAKAEEAPHDVGGGIVTATVIDPFGNAFGVIENPHFNREKVK